MILGDAIRSGVRWLVFGNVGGQVLQFAFGVALARILVPADFGLLVTTQVFTGMAGLFMSGGMGQALLRSKEASPRDFDAVFTAQLAVGVLTYLVFFASAPLVAKSFNDPLYEPLLRISALSFVVRPMLNTRNIWLHREMQFQSRTVIGLLAGIISGVASVAMALTGMGVFALVLSGFVGSLFTLVALDRFTPRCPRFALDYDAWRRLGSYGAKVTVNDLAWYASKQTPNVIISHLAGPAAVGLFNKAESTAMLPFSTLSTSVYDAVLRAMAKVQDNADQTKYLFFRTITLLMVYTLPFYIGIAWIAEPFIRVVYGEKWLPVVEPLQIMAMTGLLYCVEHPCGAVLAAQNRVGREVFVHLFVVIALGLGLIVGYEWGLSGAAWTVLVVVGLKTPIMYRLAVQCFPHSLRDVLAAVVPGIRLNAILVASLMLADWLLPDAWQRLHPVLYMTTVATWAATVYLVCFLAWPVPSLRSEAMRVRKLFRLLGRSCG